MERYFIFNEKNTFYDWNLLLTSKTITPPEPKTNNIEINGMSGSIDLSEALTGEITYFDRSISMSFWTDYGSRNDRNEVLRKIRTNLHGRKIKIIEPDDPKHYFYGRVKITNESNVIPYAEISVDATCEPWRYSLCESERIVNVNGSSDVVITNHGVKTLCPDIHVDGNISIVQNDLNISLTNGVYKISDLKFYSGSNVLNITGRGVVKFVYREADL